MLRFLRDFAPERNASQGDLFGETAPKKYPDSPGFKARGTSSEAAKRIAPQVSGLRRETLAEFMAAHPKGLTADQAARLLSKSPLSIRPRCSELRRAGFIEPTAERCTNDDSGMSATVWRASPKAMEDV